MLIYWYVDMQKCYYLNMLICYHVNVVVQFNFTRAHIKGQKKLYFTVKLFHVHCKNINATLLTTTEKSILQRRAVWQVRSKEVWVYVDMLIWFTKMSGTMPMFIGPSIGRSLTLCFFRRLWVVFKLLHLPKCLVSFFLSLPLPTPTWLR